MESTKIPGHFTPNWPSTNSSAFTTKTSTHFHKEITHNVTDIGQVNNVANQTLKSSETYTIVATHPLFKVSRKEVLPLKFQNVSIKTTAKQKQQAEHNTVRRTQPEHDSQSKAQ